MGCRRVDLFHYADDFLQFVHERRFVLQAAGGVDQQHLDSLIARFGQRLERQPGRISTRRPGNHGCA